MPTKIKNSNIVDGTITSSKLALSGITAGEGGTCADTAPAGYVFNRKDFSSYGTPNGSCGAFTISGCHSISSGNWSPTLPAASYSMIRCYDNRCNKTQCPAR